MAVRFLTNEDKQELNDKICPASTDARYFDIDYDGVVCLKPEYRGHPTNTTYPYAVSDNGVGTDGSKIEELPEKIIIPEYIGDTPVSGFRAGMFHYNYRVKEIVLPDGVSELPDYFCRYAKNLKVMSNTAGVTKLGSNVLAYTSVKKALFPNLIEVSASALASCGYLKIADIGNKITEIPEKCFNQCFSLSVVKGGKSVTKIGKQAFHWTRSLKNLSFLSQVTEIGEKAFYFSRIQYDWSSLTGECTFGNLATPIIDNIIDYWSGVEFTPCENPLNTLMSQHDPVWSNSKIGETTKTYLYGCATFCILHIHSAFSGKTYSHPDEFVAELKSAGYTLTDSTNPTDINKVCSVFETLGYKTTPYIGTEKTTAEMYKAMLDALARGAYIYTQCGTANSADSGHVIILYGVNSIGEVMIANSDYPPVYSFGESGVNKECFVYHMPYQNTTGPDSDFIIVEKQ